jgi:hypothetical protein
MTPTDMMKMRKDLEDFGSRLLHMEQLLHVASNTSLAIQEEQNRIHTKLQELVAETKTIDPKLFGIIHGNVKNLVRLEHCMNQRIMSIQNRCTWLNNDIPTPTDADAYIQSLLDSVSSDVEAVQGDN